MNNIFFTVQNVKNLPEYKERCSILGITDEERIGERIEEVLGELVRTSAEAVCERLVDALNNKYIVKNDADKEIKYDIIGWTSDNVYYFFYSNNFLRKSEFRSEISKELRLNIGSAEYQEFWKIIDLVGKIIEEYYKGTSFGEILEKRKSFPVIKRTEEVSKSTDKNNGKKTNSVNPKGVSSNLKSLKKRKRKNIPMLFLVTIVALTILFVLLLLSYPKNTNKKANNTNGISLPQESTSTTNEDTNTQQEIQNKETKESTNTNEKIIDTTDRAKENKLDENLPANESTPVNFNKVQNESSKTNQEINKNQDSKLM